jgi:hypothetical protein
MGGLIMKEFCARGFAVQMFTLQDMPLPTERGNYSTVTQFRPSQNAVQHPVRKNQ